MPLMKVDLVCVFSKTCPLLECLLECLRNIGIQQNCLRFFKSYLTNRRQFVIKYGVPQRSMLSLLKAISPDLKKNKKVYIQRVENNYQ